MAQLPKVDINALASNPIEAFVGSEKKRRREENTFHLDKVLLHRVTRLVNTRPEARACILAIQRRLLARGIEITKPNMQPSPEFQSHVLDKYTRFCSDMIEFALTVGVVPYVLRKAPSGMHYPHVVPPTSLDIEVTCDHSGCMTYSASQNATNVFFAVFNAVSPDGQLTSPTASLLTAHEFLHAQEMNDFIASEINARPPIFLRGERDSISNREVAQMDSYAPGVVAEHELQGHLMRNRIQMSILQTQKAHLAAMASQGANGASGLPTNHQFGEVRDGHTGLPIVDYSRGTSFVPDLFPLPDGMRVESLPLPSGSAALQAHRSYFEELCCMTYNVPRSVIQGSRGQNSSSVAMVSDATMRHTLDYFRTILGNLCLQAYRTLHGDDDEDVRVKFPSTSDINTIQALYTSGMIKREYYINALSTFMGIPVDAFKEEESAPPVPAPPDDKGKLKRDENETSG